LWFLIYVPLARRTKFFVAGWPMACRSKSQWSFGLHLRWVGICILDFTSSENFLVISIKCAVSAFAPMVMAKMVETDWPRTCIGFNLSWPGGTRNCSVD
jgi:hypothetical protein